MKTVSFCNQKGGVGKTTTTIAMVTGLVMRGFRVLAIDADPQMNLSYTSGITEGAEKNLYDVFRKAVPVQEAILHTKEGYDLIPGSLDLAAADMEFTQIGREYILKDQLSGVQGDYDFCIIDTPPSLGILTLNALTASDSMVIPMVTDAYSLQGLSHLSKVIGSVRRYSNRDLKVDGLLITHFNSRAGIDKDIREKIDQVADQLSTKLYRTVIRLSGIVKNTELNQGNLFRDYPREGLTKDYKKFIEEYLEEGEGNV